MDEILHHFEAMGHHLFVGIDRGIIILGLLRWCRISSTHSIDQEVFPGGGFFANGGRGKPWSLLLPSFLLLPRPSKIQLKYG